MATKNGASGALTKKNNQSKKSTGTGSGSHRKSSTSSRGSSSKRSYKTPGKRNDYEEKTELSPEELKLRRDVAFWLSLLVIIVIYCCFIGLISGGFGLFIKNVFVGLFGLVGYVMPIIIFTTSWFCVANRNNPGSGFKAFSVITLVISLGVFFALVSKPSVAELADSKTFWKDVYSLGKGGGVLFGGVALLFYKWLGTAGSIILSVFLVIMCVCLITGKSITTLAKKLMTRNFSFGSDVIDEGEDDSSEENVKRIETSKNKHVLPMLIEDKTWKAEKEEKEKNALLRKQEREEKRERLKELKEQREEEARVLRDKKDDERILNASFADSKASGHTVNNLSRDDLHQINIVDGKDERTAVYHAGDIVNQSYGNVKRANNMEEIKPDAFGDCKVKPKNESLHSESTQTDADKENTVKSIDEVVSNSINRINESVIVADAVYVNDKSKKDDAQTIEVIDDSFIHEDKSISGNTDKEREKTDVPKNKALFDTAKIEAMPDPVTERTHEKEKEANKEIIDEQNQSKIRKVSHNRNDYVPPKISLLNVNNEKNKGDTDKELKTTALKLQETLKTFGVGAQVTDISQGPSVTRYELTLDVGVKVNKVVSLVDDIKLNLAAEDIRIEAPIPGKAAVGIEVPNKEAKGVYIRELLESSEFKKASSNITFGVGKDISGQTIVADIAKMPHMLIAGATGSGKSVCINTLIMSILYKAHPDDVKLIMIDPKVVELSVYNGIPHLMIPVVTDPKKASAALMWAVNEMTNRYNSFAALSVRDLKGFNEKALAMQKAGEENAPSVMPQIIVIVDELADLMMVASKEVEESICRLAQLARAAGIHLIIATQRPSVDVITGLIKANMPSRVAFKVSSGVDSRTILDMVGAERLLGKGDMLFFPQGISKPLRVQGAFVSDKEVSDVVQFLAENNPGYTIDDTVNNKISNFSGGSSVSSSGGDNSKSDFDEYFIEACKLVVEKGSASSGMLQRVYRIGFNRAARMVDQMESLGIVGGEMGTKARPVLVDSIGLDEILSNL